MVEASLEVIYRLGFGIAIYLFLRFLEVVDLLPISTVETHSEPSSLPPNLRE
eukprot:SAG31_NODE_12784_length_917_cov_1.105134_1_plen_52_part_00